jgi:serine/threonine protein kinase
MRLEALGEGNFGEVFKASYRRVRGRGVVTIPVAVKTLKISDNMARGELLREAALMTLFEHPNLVAAIGESGDRPLNGLPTRAFRRHQPTVAPLAAPSTHHSLTRAPTWPQGW